MNEVSSTIKILLTFMCEEYNVELTMLEESTYTFAKPIVHEKHITRCCV